MQNIDKERKEQIKNDIKALKDQMKKDKKIYRQSKTLDSYTQYTFYTNYPKLLATQKETMAMLKSGKTMAEIKEEREQAKIIEQLRKQTQQNNQQIQAQVAEPEIVDENQLVVEMQVEDEPELIVTNTPTQNREA